MGGSAVVARPFHPADGANAASVVLAELARLWDQAVHRAAGGGQRPTQKQLAAVSKVPLTTINSWAKGVSLPRDLDQLAAVGMALARWAGEEPPTARDWEQLLRTDQAARSVSRGGEERDVLLGRLVAELTDPFVLEVHRPVMVDSSGTELPVLPPYVRRIHDAELGQVVARADGGRSAMAVLVGGSSTGKTRACWEAIHVLPRGWRLWHPFDPTRPEAVLAQLPQVGPQTVVWLNETQLYLDTPGDTGERVAAALHTLLTDPGREPVLVLGTLWPSHWDNLTRVGVPGDPHAQARLVLAGTDISVPTAFTGAALQDLKRLAADDVRLARAVTDASDGQVTQYLAGVPELLARYRNAPPAAAALIHTAMDARRLGHRLALPLALLEAAAPAYLTDNEWDVLGEDWLEQALAYTSAPCKGVPGPLTRIRPRTTGSRTTGPSVQGGNGRRTAGQASHGGGPLYRLADYLDQHGRRHRNDQVPLGDFWAAIARSADRGDQAALGGAAYNRGLYRDAAQLYKCAATRGDPDAAASLIVILHAIHPTDHRPAQWAAAHVALHAPEAVASLMSRLREVGAAEQVSVLLGRDPAAHVALDDTEAVVTLLESLYESSAGEQVTVLAGRAAIHVAIGNPYVMAILLDCMQKVEAGDHVTTLLGRDPAAHVAPDDPSVGRLLASLRKVGADDQVPVLADRAAVQVAIDDPYAVASLLESLDWVGAREQAILLLDRDPAGHVALSDPDAVGYLLESLREVGADDQVTVLADRAAVEVAIDNPYAVASILESLERVDAREQAILLLHRDPAGHVALSDPDAVGYLLESLREVGADDQVTVLADRAAVQVAIDDADAVASLLESLDLVGAHNQVTLLLDRDPAGHVSLSDPYAVASLLESLGGMGAEEQMSVLLGRDPAAHVALDDADAVGYLLESLRAVGAGEQVSALLGRDPAAHVALTDPDAVADLLKSLREVSPGQQDTALAARLTAAGMFDLFQKSTGSRYRFGRYPGGSPAESWGWDDLS
jgi:uncharacterized protein YidB (DUF937 family)